MRRGEHAADDGSFGRSAGGAMARGIVLIIAAVALGLVLLNATDGPEPFRTAAGSATEGDDETVDPADDGEGEDGEDGESTGTTSTTAAVRPPAEVRVLVANGSGVRGAAAGLADTIAGFGYQIAEPANAPSPVATSVIHFLPGFEREAQALAAQLNPAPAVSVMPDPQPVTDLRNAQILVLQAADLAPSG
jgi:hypothetical protein